MDATGLIPKVAPSDITEVQKYNSCAHHRGKWFLNGVTFKMQRPLLADVCNLNRFLNNINVAFKLYRSTASFVIGAKDAAQGYKILLDEIYMLILNPPPGS